MWIVAIAWVYVVGLMSVTETSIVAGVMTFLGYCVLPLSILFYLTGGKRRRHSRERAAANSSAADTSASASTDSPDGSTGSDSGSDKD